MGISKRLFQIISSKLSTRNIYFTKSLSYLGRKQALPPNFDYVRYATLGLCFNEINNKDVKGAVAEVGVYKGDFSIRLNKLFSDRKLYLFDTFSGFDASDIDIETQKQFSKGNQDFSDTSENYVLARMPYPENCEIKKGKFPSTTEGLDETFCFESLDADLYEPIYQGLTFFYPRLEKGGFIFVHDYNNKEYPGSAAAVQKFASELYISFVPIPDVGGSVIFTK